jgi:ribosomal-protein-alanine N-acetyltransferase
MLDEAHVTTIAVRPSERGQGIGELLFIGLIDIAASLGARFVTLEVRASNYVAQQLYKKFGFREEGVRRRYYSDNGEDALIMWSEPLGSPAFQNRLARLKAELDTKLAHARPPKN